MFVVAAIGLIANLLAILLIKKDKEKNLNIRAAYLHLLGDTLSSAAVIVGGILIYLYDLYWLDPVLTVLISLYIIKETWQILRQTVDILMQATPADLNLDHIKRDLELIEEVNNIHHVHAWNLDDRSSHFECHVDLKENYTLKETEKIRTKIESILKENHHIDHITIQFEYCWCDDENMIHH